MMDRREWMRLVMREIHFAPDRKKIRQELLEHMEDRMEEYLEQETAAEARVLASMGDPVEVGRELNRQHKPWLGWLWLSEERMIFMAEKLMAAIPAAEK